MRRKKKIIKAVDIEDDVVKPTKRKSKKKKATKKKVAKKAAAKKAAKKVSRKKKPKKRAPVKAKAPEAPAVHTASKTEDDPLESRFRSLLPDIEGLTEKIIETDLDHTQAMEVTSRVDDLVDWAPNAIAWCQDKRFLGMTPFAKQCEILLHLFEEYCPRCSDMDYVRDVPVRDPIEAVLSKVALMEFGTCPHCKYNKAQGRADGIFIDPVELVAPVGQRSGKCLDGGTEVLANGERRTVESLVGEVFTVPTKTENNKIAYAEATAFESGQKECVELVADHGSSVILSTDHRVFTPQGWVEAGRLSEGDLVAMPRAVPEPETPLSVSDDEVAMVAYLLSDGNVAGTSTRFTNETEPVVREFIEVGDRLADGRRSNAWRRVLSDEQVQEAAVLVSEGWSQSRVAAQLGVSQPCISEALARLDKEYLEGVVKEDEEGISYRARGLTWLKDKWGLRGKAVEKRIPAQFWGLSNQQLSLFLNRFWACDGYIQKAGVGITLASERMVDDLQFLLLRLGIRASKRYRLAKCQTGEYDAWRLEVSGFDAVNFVERVGPVLGKEESCLALVRTISGRKQPKSLTDPVPIARPELREIADEIQAVTGRRCRHEVREFASAKDSGFISRQMFENLCAAYSYEGSYRWLAETELRWQRVRSIEPKGVRRVYDLSVPGPECFIASGMVLHNSAVTAMASSYLLHRNLMLPVPWKEYGLTPGQLLDFTFVATTMTQSERTLWATFKGMFTQSQWFKSYKEVCDTEGRKKGVLTTVKNLETYILFGHKNLLIYFAANDPSGLRGSTRVGGAIDELSWFGNKDGGKRANGKETYAALNNSCLTLRTAFADKLEEDPNCNWPLPMLFNVSSPVSMDDPLMTLYRDSAESPRAVRKHWATWEAHPKNTKKRLTELGEMAKPTADRDYGAQPPLAHNPLISRTDIVTEAFKNPLATESRYGPIIRPYALGYTEEVETPIGARTAMMLTAGLVDKSQVPEPNWEVLKALPEDELARLGASRTLFDGLVNRPPSQRMHIMGVDLGSSNNSLAVCCGFLSDDNRFVTDFLVEVNPRDTLTINVADVYENLIVKLVDELNVVAVFYDRWNSLHQIQDLATRFGSLGPLNDKVTRRSWLRKLTKMNKRPAFIADKYSLNMADATMLASRLEQGDCLFPSMEVGFMDLMVNRHLDASAYPFTHLALQMATVRASGNRLLKPLNRDDDLFRAWANAAVPALKDELVMDLLKQDHRAQPGDRRGASNFHVSLGQGGKGIRPVSNLTSGTISTGPADFPVVVRRGTYRG